MLMNVEQFKNFVNKATLNYYIDSVQLNYDPDKDVIWSKMISASSEAATILSIPNNIFSDIKEDIQLNFCNPKTELKPFIELIDDEEVMLKLHKNKVVVNNNLKLHFDDPSVISVFNSDGPLDDIEYFTEITINNNFINNFKKIKKIGNRFGKVYFTVSDNVLYIETMDKNNSFSNGISFEIGNVDYKDLSMCFNYNILVNLFNVLGDEYNEFTLKLAYIEEKEGGMIYVCRGDQERYFLMSMVLD